MSSTAQTITLIDGGKTSFASAWIREIWAYRELLYFLVWRDLKVRYKQSVLGVLWVLIQPLATMLVFTAVFHYFLHIRADADAPYPVFVYSALVAWTYFAGAVARCAESLVGNASLVSKIYFPRMLLPISAVISVLVDFGVALVILLVLLLVFGVAITPAILALPVVTIAMVSLALGVGLWLSSVNVQYRDVKYVTPVLLQIWMYATPIIYPLSYVPEQWQWLYALNPMVHVVVGFRSVLVSGVVSFEAIALPMIIGALVLLSGVLYFKRTEDAFADVV